MKYEIKTIEKKSDERGYLVEFLKNSELPQNIKEFGQVYYVNFAKKGVIRGNHYHSHKYEYFGMAFGKVQLDIEDINTKERKSFIVDSDEDKFMRICIGPNIAHAVKSLTDYAILINYFTKEYTEENPDTFKYDIL